MKQIVTLLVLALVCLFTKTTQAQFSQNFDVNGSFSSNCWDFNGFFLTTSSAEVINGTASLYSNPPVNSNGSGSRDVNTPYLNIASTSFSVSFNYKLTGNLNGQSVRQIEIGLLNRDGLFTSLDVLNMNRNTPNMTLVNTYAKTFTLASTSVQRLVLKLTGDQGSGHIRFVVDDLLASANAYYGPTTSCNTPPVAANDLYNAASNTLTYTGVSVLNNDSDPNGESLTAALATPSLDGTVVMNPDGTFTFTPIAGFTGSFTSFTYTLTDNGYNRLATTASVSIYFPQVTTLPVQLLYFSGNSSKGKTGLSWSVAANETGLLFDVQRSSNGNVYQTIATVFNSEKAGDEQYQFAEAASGETRYRLKIVNKDGTFFYSNVISFKSASVDDKIVLLQNPVQTTLRFTVTTASGISKLVIYNPAGAVVYSEKKQGQKGNNSYSLALQANLPAGMYMLEVVTASGSKTTTFIKH